MNKSKYLKSRSVRPSVRRQGHPLAYPRQLGEPEKGPGRKERTCEMCLENLLILIRHTGFFWDAVLWGLLAFSVEPGLKAWK